jgi:hypothetical protein
VSYGGVDIHNYVAQTLNTCETIENIMSTAECEIRVAAYDHAKTQDALPQPLQRSAFPKWRTILDRTQPEPPKMIIIY